MTNVEIFKHSAAHSEPMYDPYYTGNLEVIPRTIDESNDLTTANQKVIELISAYNVLRENKEEPAMRCVDKIIDDIIMLLDRTNHVNFLPFVQFFMTKNANFALYKKIPQGDKATFIRQMLDLYCAERHGMYLSHGYSNSTLQVVCDNYSHKRNCKTTINKIESMLASYKYRKSAKAVFCAKSREYFLPDKTARSVFEQFRNAYKIEFKAQEIGKLPDMVFNIGENIYIMEMKSMKLSGGGQNHQAAEIVNFIRYAEKDARIHYLTFLDSDYANEFFDKRSPKIKKQYDDALDNLERYPGNFFVNTEGFRKFLADNLG